MDIGAWDPKTFSNSRALIEAGWSALLIEPSPGPVKNLIREYADNPSVRVLAGAVTVEGHVIELAITDDAVSMPSSDKQRVEEWTSVGGFYGKLLVPSMSMEKLFWQFGGDFKMISIDTEGTSVPLFCEMLRLGVRPKCVVVEHDNRIVELNQYAAAAGYRQQYLNGTNAVFRWDG